MINTNTANKFLNYLFGVDSNCISPNDKLYIGLLKENLPSSGVISQGNEPAIDTQKKTTGYQRVAISDVNTEGSSRPLGGNTYPRDSKVVKFSSASSGTITNKAEIKFDVARRDWGLMKYWFLTNSENGTTAILWGSIKDVVQEKMTISTQDYIHNVDDLVSLKTDKEYIILWKDPTLDSQQYSKQEKEFRFYSSKNYFNLNVEDDIKDHCIELINKPMLLEDDYMFEFNSDNSQQSLTSTLSENFLTPGKNYCLQIDNEIYDCSCYTSNGENYLSVPDVFKFSIKTTTDAGGTASHTLTVQLFNKNDKDENEHFLSVHNINLDDEAPFRILTWVEGNHIDGFHTKFKFTMFEGDKPISTNSRAATIYGVGIDVTRNTVPTLFENQLEAKIDLTNE